MRINNLDEILKNDGYKKLIRFSVRQFVVVHIAVSLVSSLIFMVLYIVYIPNTLEGLDPNIYTLVEHSIKKALLILGVWLGLLSLLGAVAIYYINVAKKLLLLIKP